MKQAVVEPVVNVVNLAINSKSAREARALAVERRLLALQGSKPGND